MMFPLHAGYEPTLPRWLSEVLIGAPQLICWHFELMLIWLRKTNIKTNASLSSPIQTYKTSLLLLLLLLLSLLLLLLLLLLFMACQTK